MNIPTKKRIETLDLLKGLVMVIMAIDHVRGYFHYSSYYFNPSNPELSTVPIFFTRFITHFCAPAFSFLAGISAFMVGRKKTKAALSGFLIKRGLWLVFAELVIISFGWYFDPGFRAVTFQVIWVLGISMIVLAGLIHLPKNVLLLLSCVIIFGHNLLDPIHLEGNILWAFLHERGPFLTTADHNFVVLYPLIPWVAVMSLGYCFGSFYSPETDPSRRRKLFRLLGMGAIALFVLLRGTNVYGNLLPWEDYGNFWQNLFSFLNLSKYPPSLSFLLVTLGGTLLFLSSMENAQGRTVNFLCVFGRVPFFFYIVHIYLIHFFAMLTAELTGFGWQKMILPGFPGRVEELKGFGFPLAHVYLIWIFVVAILYPACKKFDLYKQNHKEKWWLTYL